MRRLTCTTAMVLLGLAAAANATATEWLYDFYDGSTSVWTGGKSPADPVSGADNWITPSNGYPGTGTVWPFIPTPPTGDAIMWRRSTVPTTEWSVLASTANPPYSVGSQAYTRIMMHWAPHTRQNNGAFSYQIPAAANWFELEFDGKSGPGTYPSAVSKTPPAGGYYGWGSTNVFGLINASGAVEVYFGATQAFWSDYYVRNTMSDSGNWSDFDERTHLGAGRAGSLATGGGHTYKLHVDLDGVYGASGTGTMYIDGAADPSLTEQDMGLTSHPSTWTGLFFMVNGLNDAFVDDFVIRAPIPEPTTLSLVVIGALGMVVRHKRK